MTQNSFYLDINLTDLMSAGVHYGHQTHRWNSKMNKYIYTQKKGIHILDLIQTIKLLTNACNFAFEASKQKKTFLFVGTKYQASHLISKYAQKSNSYYISNRWLGGMLTNWSTIQARINRLILLEEKYNNNEFDNLPKKEAALLMRQLQILQKNLGGVKLMTRLPDVIIVVDQNRESIAIAESRKLSIPIISLVDTNCDPELSDYPIPANDDAVSSIQYILSKLSDAINTGK